MSPTSRHFSVFRGWSRVPFVVFLSLLVTVSSPSSSSGDTTVHVSNDDIVLVWERSCMKHLAAKEWDRARDIQNVITWQRAHKRGIQVFQRDMPSFVQQLQEARESRQVHAATWGCNPPDAQWKGVLLRIGPDPQAASPITNSFVTNAPNSIEVQASAELAPSCPGCTPKWDVSVPAYNIIAPKSGEVAWTLRLSIPEAPLGDRSDDHEIIIKGTLIQDGTPVDDLEYRIKPDAKDQLRQEYVDMRKSRAPSREELVRVPPPFGAKPGAMDFNQFNTSRRRSGEKYDDILFTIRSQLAALAGEIGNATLTINSGYRNPFKNRLISAAQESRHIYGDAADIRLSDVSGDGVADFRDRELIVSAAQQHGACVEPDELTPTWVHMDWRGACPTGW